MSGSALLGTLPNNDRDRLILEGFWKLQRLTGAPIKGKTTVIPALKPDGADHHSRVPYVIACSVVVIILTSLITSTRLLLRAFRRDLRWGADDWAILVGSIGVVTFFALTIAMSTLGGGGRHMYDNTYENYYWFFIFLGVRQALYYPVLGVIKISITLFNRRVTGFSSHKWQICHYTFLALLVIFIFTSILTNMLLCVPTLSGYGYSLIRMAEDTDMPPLKCINADNVVVAFSAIHSAMDFMLLCVPIIILYKMQTTLGKKIRLGFLFSVGSVSCIGSVMRQVIQKSKKQDLMYQWPDLLKWVIVDMFFAVVVASLPMLNPMLGLVSYRRSRASSPPRSGKGSDLSLEAEKGRQGSKGPTAEEREMHKLDSSAASETSLTADESQGFSRKGSRSRVQVAEHEDSAGQAVVPAPHPASNDGPWPLDATMKV